MKLRTHISAPNQEPSNEFSEDPEISRHSVHSFPNTSQPTHPKIFIQSTMRVNIPSLAKNSDMLPIN